MTPFPIGTLPKVLADFVRAGAAAMGCDESYFALPLLTAVGAAIGNTRRIRLKGTWTEPPVLWTAIVGPSGTLKSPAFELALRAVHRRQRTAFNEYRAAQVAYEAELKAWKAQPKADRGEEPEAPASCEHFLCSDVTVEALADRLGHSPRGVLVAVDELAGWFGSFNQYKAGGGSDVPHWLTMFGARSLKVDRKGGDRPTLYVPHAAVSLTGGIQPQTLRRALTPQFFENGLAARILLAMPPERVKQWTDAEMPDDAANAMTELFDALYAFRGGQDVEGNPAPADLGLADEAREVWIAFYDEHAREQAGLQDDGLRAAWSKLEGYAARLALIVHCVRQAATDVADPWRVDAESIEAGVAVARWFAAETKRIYGMLATDDEQREEDELIVLIKAGGGTITERTLQRGPRRYRPNGAATAALTALIIAGVGEWFYPPQPDRGRQPERAFRLFNPMNGEGGDTGDGDRIPHGDSASGVYVAVAGVAGDSNGNGRPLPGACRNGGNI